MDNKTKIILGIVVAAVGGLCFSTASSKLNEDPVVSNIQAEFVGTVEPGQSFTKSMFEVKGITESGKLIKLNSFDSKTKKAAEHGGSCEIDIEAQGKTSKVIVDITRQAAFKQNIGYPDEKNATVTYYKNGDLEFEGKGEVTNFPKKYPWESFEYSHVYIDERLEFENMDGWFEGNENLVYCDDLPKTVKTMKKTFSGCKSLEKTPGYFQCSNLKIIDYAFSGCESLRETDILPVNVSSARYSFENCKNLQNPVDMSKTSNLTDITGMHSGCEGLIEATKIPNSVISMGECYKNCINIKSAVPFPPNVQDITSAYEGCKGMIKGASIPESVISMSKCYQDCSALSGDLEINSDTSDYKNFLVEANTNGDKLSIFGNSGNLLAIQKDAQNSNIVLADPEAAAQQNERLFRENETLNN